MDSTARPSHLPPARAFTLIELLVVIGIIVLLVALTVTVGFRVTGTGKAKQTEQALRVLDQALTEYISAAGRNPRPWVIDPRPYSPPTVQPVFDGVNQTDGEVINSVALFVLQCREYPSADALFKNLDTKILKEREFDGDFSGTPPTIPLPTVLDGWGNPIRYVHPAFGGNRTAPNNPQGFVDVYLPSGTGLIQTQPRIEGQFATFGIQRVRRNDRVTKAQSDAGVVPDSDGGYPAGNRPYFYSAGPDGRVGYVVNDSTGEILVDYNDDNIYITTPSFSRQ
jgi:prepilin-type N-terminal cleavage/methylation domain-containing protein